MNAIAMTFVLVGTLSFFSWSVYRRFRQMKVGVPDARFNWSFGQIVDRTTKVLMVALGQEKMWRKKGYLGAGLAHIVIFAAFNVLLLNSILLWGRGYDYDWDFFFGLLSTDHMVGKLYSLSKEGVAAACMAGCLFFWYLRINKKGHDSPDPDASLNRARMTLGKKAKEKLSEPNIILGIIFTMMLADFIYVGGHVALEAQAAGVEATWHWYEPIGSLLAMGIDSGSRSYVKWHEHIGFWWHAAWVLLFLNILPYSKHFHILTVMPSVYAYDPKPAALPPVVDLEGRVEREESVGIATLSDLTYKHILDLYTCTECGRCSDNCPAYITDKVLSPKHLTLAVRDHLYASETEMFGKTDGVRPPTDGPFEVAKVEDKQPIKTYPPAPEGAYFLSSKAGAELIGDVLSPDVVWSCTSCRACEEQCPVMISYVDKIIGMRRELVMMKAEFPPQLQTAFRGIESNGNPYNFSRMDRGKWTEGLGVQTVEENPGADVLYWVGCAASFDDRAKKVSRSVARLLQAAGVDFAILAEQEQCTGDPARRAGNEFLFQMLAEGNVETLKEVGAEKKTIITACPHCFNTLANEYPDFGGHYDVVHHSEYLKGLLSAGKLTPTHPVTATIAYHDSCYLGRYNAIYDSPRQVLESIEGVTLVEVDYWNKQQGLCCGAGGAQMFMEETGGTRVNQKRTLQLIDTGADTVASACPFCMTMIGDGIKETADERGVSGDDDVKQLDIAEILAEACGVSDARLAAAAAE